jgi:hypothetical protein
MNDTVVFAWDKSLASGTTLTMSMWSDTYFTWEILDRCKCSRYLALGPAKLTLGPVFDNFTYTSKNFTFKIREPVMFSESMYGSRFHFNLIQESYRSYWDEWSLDQLVARSDSFSIVKPVGAETTWTASPSRLATTPTGHSTHINQTSKVAIGLAVPLGILLVGIGCFVMWRQKQRQERNRDRLVRQSELRPSFQGTAELDSGRALKRDKLLDGPREWELEGRARYELPT